MAGLSPAICVSAKVKGDVDARWLLEAALSGLGSIVSLIALVFLAISSDLHAQTIPGALPDSANALSHVRGPRIILR
jgi:hypothetical protein